MDRLPIAAVTYRLSKFFTESIKMARPRNPQVTKLQSVTVKIFLSFSSKQRRQAEEICYALLHDGHDVFLDSLGIAPGEAVHKTINDWIERGDLFIFLISPDSTKEGSYPLSELEVAKGIWKAPARRVLPVMIEPTAMESIPAYLCGVNILEPKGKPAPEIASAVRRIGQQPILPPSLIVVVAYALAATGLVLLGFIALGADVRDFHAGVYLVAAILGMGITYTAHLVRRRLRPRRYR